MRVWRVAICDRAGWRKFDVQLDAPLSALVMAANGALITELRDGLRDERFTGHAMVIEPAGAA